VTKYLIVCMLLITPAMASPIEVNIDCEQVRRLIAEHGKLAAIKWAISNGFSMRQINQARKQCSIK
jgi:hypothetical protein